VGIGGIGRHGKCGKIPQFDAEILGLGRFQVSGGRFQGNIFEHLSVN